MKMAAFKTFILLFAAALAGCQEAGTQAIDQPNLPTKPNIL
jgi:hypothetical protein